MIRDLPLAVLLDLDDTILDDSSYVTECWREACVAHRSELGDVDPEILHQTIERIRRWFWGDSERHRVGRLDMGAARREVVRLSLAELGRDDPKAAEMITKRYIVQRDLAMQPLPDAIETVRWLRERGCRLALLTNGNGAAQRRKIERFGLAELFDLVLIEGELGFGKPDARVYRMALERLGAAPTDSWMVGDNLEWDVAGSQRLGIFGVWVDTRGAGVPSGHAVRPDRVVRRLSDLREESP